MEVSRPSSRELEKILKINPRFDSKLIEEAFQFAKEAHQGQKRVSGEDFISHPIAVAKNLAPFAPDSQTIAAALLHDVLDDTSKTIKDIEKNFGEEIAFLVEGVSKLGKMKYRQDSSQLKSDNRAENLRKMFLAMAEDVRVILIKFADRLHNLETLHYLPPQKQKRIASETMEIYAPLAERLGIGESKGKLEDFSFPYLYPTEYSWLLKSVKEKYQEREEYLKRIRPILKKELKKEKIKVIDIHFRAKHYWSLYRKLLKYDMNLEKIYDLVALRVIVKNTPACYATLGVIHKLWRPLPERIKDFISLPKPNGYRALHTTVFCKEGKLTEIQIKTPEMHKGAEYGIAAHWVYSESGKSAQRFKLDQKKFYWLKQIQEWQKETKSSEEFFEKLKIDFFRNRIFVITPRGDVIDLPQGACPVDFAYQIHTDLGTHCSGAKVNGKMVSLNYSLQSGEVVEIITKSNQSPSRNWLEFVKTNFAKAKIKNWLKQFDREENLKQGLDILNRELRDLKNISWNNIPKNKKEELLKNFPYKDLEGLLIAIGQGEVSISQVIKELFAPEEIFAHPNSTHNLWRGLKKFIPKKIKAKLATPDQTLKEIKVGGERGILIRIAHCCHPLPGEKIKASITKGQGATIHKSSCKNLKKIAQNHPDKIIPAYWLGTSSPNYSIFLEITAQDRIGLLQDISSSISNLGLKILSLNAQTKEDQFRILTSIELSNIDELRQLLSRLKSIKGIIKIKRK